MNEIEKTEFHILSVKKTESPWELEVLGAPYGGPEGGKDGQGEFFSEKTDFAIEPGDSRPVFYYHGEKQNMPELIGKAIMTRRDSKGVWFKVILDKTKSLAKRVYGAAMRGVAYASSGTMGYLKRKVRQTGEILNWPIGELTLLDAVSGRRPANWFASVNLAKAFKTIGEPIPDWLEDDELIAELWEALVDDD